MWKQQSILTFNTETKQWSKTRFDSFLQYRKFIDSQWKMPGEYNFQNTEYWIQPALKFKRDKRYCDFHPSSKEYKEFWLLERRKCEQGIIVDGVWLSPDIYFFWNYCPIYEKISQDIILPKIWDGHYHYDLYLQLAVLYGEDAAMTKARQRGISLYHMARMTRRLWFGKKSTLKVLGHEELYVTDEWGIMESYRNHLNEFTGWYRHFLPNETLNWEQKREITEGTASKKKIYKGNKSKIRGLTTKMSSTRGVGGPATEIYITEAGVNPRLKKIKEFVDPNLKIGNVKTGLFVAAGAVGELKDCEDLMEWCFNPKPYNIRSVPDTFSGTGEPIAFFFPEEWNYTHQDEETGEVIECYDKDGNSDIELAVKYIQEEEARQKKKDESSYKLWKSQHCRTLKEAFAQRENNPFPVMQLQEQEFKILPIKPIIIRLKPNPNKSNRLIHEFSDDIPVSKLRPNPKEDNRGALIVTEFPIDNPPFGLYYIGIDPIFNKDTETSRSLMSMSVWIGTHERDGKIVEPYPVAFYTGRHTNVRDTYQICLDTMRWYNARTAVECNVKDFIEWVIKEGESRYLMRRRELTAVNELVPESTIRDEIGVFMEGKFKERCLEKLIAWLETPIASDFNLTTGDSKYIFNTSKIFDPMLLKEMMNFTPKKNTDRLIAFMLGLIATQSDTNRHIINTVKNPFTKPKEIVTISPSKISPFSKSIKNTSFTKMPSPFSKR